MIGETLGACLLRTEEGGSEIKTAHYLEQCAVRFAAGGLGTAECDDVLAAGHGDLGVTRAGDVAAGNGDVGRLGCHGTVDLHVRDSGTAVYIGDVVDPDGAYPSFSKCTGADDGKTGGENQFGYVHGVTPIVCGINPYVVRLHLDSPRLGRKPFRPHAWCALNSNAVSHNRLRVAIIFIPFWNVSFYARQ